MNQLVVTEAAVSLRPERLIHVYARRAGSGHQRRQDRGAQQHPRGGRNRQRAGQVDLLDVRGDESRERDATERASDDAGEGAAWGAAAGVVGRRRKAKSAQKGATEQAQAQAQQVQQASAEQIQNFKKAFTACLEAKDYTVKY